MHTSIGSRRQIRNMYIALCRIRRVLYGVALPRRAVIWISDSTHQSMRRNGAHTIPIRGGARSTFDWYAEPSTRRIARNPGCSIGRAAGGSMSFEIPLAHRLAARG